MATIVQDKKKRMVVLAGFSYSTEHKVRCNADRQVNDILINFQIFFHPRLNYFYPNCEEDLFVINRMMNVDCKLSFKKL